MSAAPASAATITFGVASPVTVGSAFDVTVQATNVFAGRPAGDLLVGFEFGVTVGDMSVFQFNSADVGGLFTSFSSGSTVIGFTNNPAGLAAGDFSEPLTLAILHFTALKAGLSTIGISSNPALDEGLAFAADPIVPLAGSTQVQAVGPVSSVPEPSTITLMLAPVVALFRRARRRREDAASGLRAI